MSVAPTDLSCKTCWHNDSSKMLESGTSVVSTNAVAATERSDLKAVGPTAFIGEDWRLEVFQSRQWWTLGLNPP